RDAKTVDFTASYGPAKHQILMEHPLEHGIAGKLPAVGAGRPNGARAFFAGIPMEGGRALRRL
ncbi:MAG: hypothetical protein ACP5O1_09680, partial [Phycisphaerae bacterium]